MNKLHVVNESNRGEGLFPVPFIARSLSSVLPSLYPRVGGGGLLPHEKGGDARRLI